MKQLLLCLVIGSVLLRLGYSQSTILTGKISDATSGEPLKGATVLVIGTYQGAYSKDDGTFEITGLKPGDYSVRFSYIGFAEKIYHGTTMIEGEPTNMEVSMVPTVQTLGEVEIVGQRNLIDLESGKSLIRINSEEIGQLSVENVQDIVALQVGVNETPDGIQIRGGRIYETEYLIEGINAQDPLAGTGFGVEVQANAIENVEVITGGSGAAYGSGSSGVVATSIKEGGKKFSLNLNYQRDNLGFNKNQGPSWNTDRADISFSGPLIGDKLTFFTNVGIFLTDNYYRVIADQLRSSLFENQTRWAPRQDNRWSNTLKFAWNISPGWKATLTNQHSLNINQNTRSLQIIGNDAVVTPGLQYFFSLDPDLANTYTHHSNLSVINLKGILGDRWILNVSLGRLFTNLRADANGRAFREETVDRILDAASIVTDPVSIFNPGSEAVFVFPGPGLANNGGIASLWHDHYAREYTVKTQFQFQSQNKTHFVTFGQEHKAQTYQWIDVERPWVGAPIRINDSLTTPSTSLGRSSDFWRVQPSTGGVFVQDEIRYKGIIASVGLRFNYWAPGKFADEAVEDPLAPVVDAVREDYREETVSLFGRRWKGRLLPRLNVSFPVTENKVLYFNYSHFMRLPHPRFVYAGLDPVFQDGSFLANLGNPNINPEVTVSYEAGLKSQLTKDWALSITAFNNDKFDYIVSRRILIRDRTGSFTEKTFFINQDFARIRGLELALTHRIGKSLLSTLSGSYSIATGKSNTAAESALQIRQQGFVNATEEQFLAWDRPFDLKFLLILTPDSSDYLLNLPLHGFRLSLTSTFKSGLRYTPFRLVRINEETGREEYERIEDQPFENVGSPWFWTDIRISRDLFLGNLVTLGISVEVQNIFNYRSAAIINGITGDAYELGDPLPLEFRDPLFPDPQNNGLPPFNPARFLAPRHILWGLKLSF